MPLTPTHSLFNLTTYYIISAIFPIPFLLPNCILLLLADTIDIDHLFSKPIYQKRRNPFKTRYFHKHWKTAIILATTTFFFYPASFFGIGIISHLFLDYTYTKYWLKMKI